MSNLAKEWELDTLSCYWDDTAACERALSSAPRFAYAVRSSGSAKGHLVLVQHTGQGRLDRTLFRRLAPACWASGAGDQFNGAFHHKNPNNFRLLPLTLSCVLANAFILNAFAYDIYDILMMRMMYDLFLLSVRVFCRACAASGAESRSAAGARAAHRLRVDL